MEGSAKTGERQAVQTARSWSLGLSERCPKCRYNVTMGSDACALNAWEKEESLTPLPGEKSEDTLLRYRGDSAIKHFRS